MADSTNSTTTVSRWAIKLVTQLIAITLVVSIVSVGTTIASNAAVGLSGGAKESLNIPRWLYVATGGAAIGASALLASFVTDRMFIRAIHQWRHHLGNVQNFESVGKRLAEGIGLVLLGLVVYRGLFGPQIPTVNFAIVFVFAGLRAGLTMAAYLFGNVWSLVNPWRTISEHLPNGFISYPSRFGRWPAVTGLLALVWIETTSGITKQPSLLAVVVLMYSVLTIIGALVFGPEEWFTRADPVSVFFYFYSRVSPFSWDSDGLQLRLPGMRLVEDDTVTGLDDIAFVVALVWELTFSGFVTTVPGAGFVRAVVDLGFPPLALYGMLYLGGFLLFVGAYLLAADITASRLQTYRTSRELAIQFAPSLLAIAAGYHLAHYFGFFVSLLPSLASVLVSPLSPSSNPLVLTLPAWFGGLNIFFVLAGHILAIWVAHSTAYRLFPTRTQAISSQYAFVVVMMMYTSVSLWLISLPTQSPAFI